MPTKADAVLEQFPWFYRATSPGKLLAQVTQALAGPLDETDGSLLRIQRAHRLRVAEEAGDVLLLAANINLPPAFFEDLLAAQKDEHGHFDRERARNAVRRMRERVERLAAIHLDGLGTVSALMTMAAAFLDARILGGSVGASPIRSVDSGGFSHVATLTVPVIPPAEKPTAELFLHENPFRRRRLPVAPRWQNDAWEIINNTVADDDFGDPLDSDPIYTIRGAPDGRTVLPRIYCERDAFTGQGRGFIFRGVVPENATLILNGRGGALLEGVAVDDFILPFLGGIYDVAAADGSASVEGFADPQAALPPFPDKPYQGEARAEDALRRKALPPPVPPGRAVYRFAVAEGRYNSPEARCDFTTYAAPTAARQSGRESLRPAAFDDKSFAFDDGCVYDIPPGGFVGMSWDERLACAFLLTLPTPYEISRLRGAGNDSAAATNADAGSVESRRDAASEVAGRVRNALPRFRAAGIVGYVAAAQDAWILGESVLRSETATDGPGIAEQTTRLRDPRAEMRVE